MKKLLKYFFIFCLVLSLCGCKKKEEEVKLADDEVVLENIMYKLNEEDSEYGIKYKIASNFRKTVLTNAVNYFSENIDGSAYFVIRIFHYKDKTIDYAIKDTTSSYDSKEVVKVGDLDYTKVHFVNYNNANTYLYYYKNKKDVYVFCFTSHIDLSRLEDIFLKNIVYN